MSRAAAQRKTQPLTKITCRPGVMGFQVFFLPGYDFDGLLAEFKAAIPKTTRGYVRNHWHVAKRAARKLSAYLDAVADRANVIREVER